MAETMPKALGLTIGQYSDKGRKEQNQDFHGVWVPKQPQLGTKGVAIALADGISSSDVGQIASEAAVTGFLEDYYCTSDAWSVKHSAQRVLRATNSWLHSQSRRSDHRYDKDRGYVCTFSAMVIKSTTAHLFHVGDARIYRRSGQDLEQLTTDHRVILSESQNYLSRALGIDSQVDIDYSTQTLAEGELFVLATDGVYEHVDPRDMVRIVQAQSDNLDAAARAIVERALDNGSPDNLTLQLVRIDSLPEPQADELLSKLTELPLPPILEPRMAFDGFSIVRELHGSSRSHIYLAQDDETGERVVIKTPSIDLGGDAAYLQRFLMEEWVARRINSAHVLKPCSQTRERHYVYVVTEYIEGQTLTQWMIDNPRPDIEVVRGLIEQIAQGLQAFHRLEMVHQDLRPENIMIDSTGTVKIIDFGAVSVAGVSDSAVEPAEHQMLGTVQYSAPEYLLGEAGTSRSDIFSLGIIAYQMITGRLPYGAQMAQARTTSAQRKVRYDSALDDDREIPVWLDGALRKAVQPDPFKRYAELSEFVYDLRHPNSEFSGSRRSALIERNPLMFWKSLSLILALLVVLLLGLQA